MSLFEKTWFVVLIGAVIRIALSVSLVRKGFFFGLAADSFLRTEFAWRWGMDFFLIPPEPHWPPLQFIINAPFVRIISVLEGHLSPWPLVATNHIFFVGSLYVLVRLLRSIITNGMTLLIAVFAAVFSYDVWMTLSGNAESILVFLTLALSCTLVESSPSKKRFIQAGAIAFLLQATHYMGWFISLAALPKFISGLLISRGKHTNRLSWLSKSGWFSGLLIFVAFPLVWLVAGSIAYGEPFFFLNATAESHSYLLRHLTIIERTFALPVAAVEAAPLLIVLAVFSITVSWRGAKEIRPLLLPPLALTLFLTSASVMSLAPVRYMGRVALLLVWPLFPFVALLFSKWDDLLPSMPKYFLAVISSLVIFGNLFQSFNFENRLSKTFIRMTMDIRNHLDSAEGAVLFTEELPWTEMHALNVLSGHPDRVFPISPEMDNNGNWLGYPETDDHLMYLAESPSAMQALLGLGSGEIYGDEFLLVSGNGQYRNPLLSARSLNGWQPVSEDQVTIGIQPATNSFSFNSMPTTLPQHVGIQKTFKVQPGGCYILNLEIKDFSPTFQKPWDFLHQVVANDIVLWSHDPMSEAFYGWKDASQFIMPRTEEVDIQILSIMQSWPDQNLDRMRASSVSVRGGALVPCP